VRCVARLRYDCNLCQDVIVPFCISGATENARPDIARPSKLWGLTSRDWTTRHQLKQWCHCPLAVRIDCCLYCRSNSGVRAQLNRTCWTISELNPVCNDSTTALIVTVACSFCVQSAILSAPIRSPYSRGSTTAAAAAARTKTRTGRHPCQQRQLQWRRNRQRQPRKQPRTTVAKCASWRHVLASHWCRANMRGSMKRVLCVCQLRMGEIDQSITIL